jgi:thiol-disulfide isomerase/thioredoxin
MVRYLFFFFLPVGCFGQGVVWEKSLAVAFEKAKLSGKPIFVEFYSPTCPHCQKVSPLLKEKVTGDLYNASFVNYALNVDTEEGRNFARDANLEVYGIPYFLFFSADSTLLHAREVSAELSSVLQPGKMMVEKTFTGQNYAKRFSAGERSENFLTHYALFSRVNRDSLTNFQVVDALWSIYPPPKRESSWFLFKKALTDSENGFVQYWLSNLAEAQKQDTPENVKAHFARLLYGTLFGPREFSDWERLRKDFSPVLGEKETEALLWEKIVRNHWKIGNDTEALDVAQSAVQQFDAGGLLYAAKVFNAQKKAPEAVQAWLSKARSLQGYNKVEYYYQWAQMERNRGNIEEARKAVEQALNLEKVDKTALELFLKEL